MTNGPVYEMLWDCAYCGTRKLLGKTHRFCPGCGAPQDPSKRYFPADDEKVAVEDHVYVGADRVCGSCDSAMSAQAAHCTQCGAAMEGAPEVQRVREAPPPPAPEPTRGRRSRFPLACGLILGAGVLLAVGLVVLFSWKKSAEAEVTGHSWERIQWVEALTAVRESAWCDQLPRGAYSVSRHREVRSHRQIPDGEDCTTRRVDQGDGTFREEQQCSPRYREEPVYDVKCDFTLDRWVQTRSAQASGQSLAEEASWPSLTLREGTCRGCERPGPREEKYLVHFRTDQGLTFSCPLPFDKWRGFGPGTRWGLDVGAVTGSPSCGSLRPSIR